MILVGRLTELDLRAYLADDILVKVDRMSMAHALEVRSPLLDHELVELAATMPTRIKIRGTKGKHILRQVLKDKLPPRSVRKATGILRSAAELVSRGRLRDFVRDTLATELPDEIFCKDTVERMLTEHEGPAGVIDHANRIWLLLTFAAWHAYVSNGGRACLRLRPVRHGGCGMARLNHLSRIAARRRTFGLCQLGGSNSDIPALLAELLCHDLVRSWQGGLAAPAERKAPRLSETMALIAAHNERTASRFGHIEQQAAARAAELDFDLRPMLAVAREVLDQEVSSDAESYFTKLVSDAFESHKAEVERRGHDARLCDRRRGPR